MDYKTFSLMGIAAIGVYVLSQMGEDKRIGGQIDTYKNMIEQTTLAANTQQPAQKVEAQQQGILQGQVRVIDARTLQFLNPDVKVEIAGIEVCDKGQLAYFNGTPWPCEPMATAWIVSQTLGREIQCQTLDRRYDATVIARCGVNGADIAAEAIVAGHALVDQRGHYKLPYDTYQSLENQARQSRVGLWSSSFTRPDEWRQSVYEDRKSQVRMIE
ncbi:endonuclease YncB(thermonuclease family) [Rhizobium skierniewicense]|uniref:Endonuclease YncB(Thermonuclease family) n=1 Tax=Rhizobium skierniewicense TaxID=984260 RepID=A0A7W6C9Z3_9HYPH|nr:thermonuclease family protein [Rhizobium skierniewicense]MBB3948398.1 endonuclease YncB(thermonuclease family) [Rhizobium skierniewicense]